jgi:hypothetical protein
MSSAAVFVFVEGDSDRFVYGQLAERAYSGLTSFRIHDSGELAGPAGKRGLIELFTFLDQQRKLCHLFEGKKTVGVFCMDKDVDDIVGEQLTSPHVVYTEFHRLENHLVRHGDLHTTIGALVQTDVASVRERFGNTAAEACHMAVERWRDWVELCLVARLNSVSQPCNYSAPSQVHRGAFGDMDEGRYHLFLGMLREALGGEQVLASSLLHARQLVSERLTNKRADEVFNGK